MSADPDYKALFEMYKKAFDKFVRMTTRYDTDWLQSHEKEKKWPCEVCMELHTELYSFEKITCPRCKQTMCRKKFIDIYIDSLGKEKDHGDDEIAQACCEECDKDPEWKEKKCLKCILELAREKKGKIIMCVCEEISCPHHIKEYHSSCVERIKQARVQE